MSATTLIEEHDKSLALLRESWMTAPVDQKAKWMGLIDRSLDVRLKLMERRENEQFADMITEEETK